MLAWIWSCKKNPFAEKGWWGQGKRIFIFSALGCDELTHTLFQICATSTCHLLPSFAILGRQRFIPKCDIHKSFLCTLQVKILLLLEYIIVHPFLVLCVIPPIHWIYSAKTFSHGMMWLLRLAHGLQEGFASTPAVLIQEQAWGTTWNIHRFLYTCLKRSWPKCNLSVT